MLSQILWFSLNQKSIFKENIGRVRAKTFLKNLARARQNYEHFKSRILGTFLQHFFVFKITFARAYLVARQNFWATKCRQLWCARQILEFSSRVLQNQHFNFFWNKSCQICLHTTEF